MARDSIQAKRHLLHGALSLVVRMPVSATPNLYSGCSSAER